ncbi:MAG: hypothetical protein ACFFC7_29635 [Candidatus Hermodarchaeota archaeon]
MNSSHSFPYKGKTTRAEMNTDSEEKDTSIESDPTTILLLDRGGLPIALQSNIEVEGQPLKLSNDLISLIGGFLNAVLSFLDRLEPLGGGSSQFSISTASNEELMTLIISPKIKKTLAKIILEKSDRILTNIDSPGRNIPSNIRNSLKQLFSQYLQKREYFQYFLLAFWREFLEKLPEVRFIAAFNTAGDYLYSSMEIENTPDSGIILSVIKETLTLFVKSQYNLSGYITSDEIPEVSLKNFPQSNIWHFNIGNVVYVFYESWDHNAPVTGLLRLRLNRIIQEHYKDFQGMTESLISGIVTFEPHKMSIESEMIRQINFKIEFDTKSTIKNKF